MHTDKIYGAYLAANATCGQVLTLDAADETVKVANSTDIPYGILLGPEGQDMKQGNFCDVAIDGEIPCLVGSGGVTKGNFVVADAQGKVVDLPKTSTPDTVFLTVGVAKESAGSGDTAIVCLKTVALMVGGS